MNFYPYENPVGFGASDFLELGVAALLLVFVLAWRPWFSRAFGWVAARPVWCLVGLTLLPVVLRLLLLPHHPVPGPVIYDEFSHLLEADTLRHWRLANPMHPMHRFFETFFVLQQPTYSSIYPVGQGLLLALGRAITGVPWAGVVAAVALFCGSCYWMLLGWTSPKWALAGGLLAVCEFGPLNLWMNDLWGGALTAAAGCLVFGGLPRLRRTGRMRYGVIIGVGIAISVLTRPYETVPLVASVLVFLWPVRRAAVAWRPAAAAVACVVVALGITLAQNKAVTGNAFELPYSLSQYQYGVPAALTIQPDLVPHYPLTPQQALQYRMQKSFVSGPETVGSFLIRLEYRIRFYRFFFLAPLYLALIVFVWTARDFDSIWILITLALFAIAINFFPAFQLHYLAAVTCLFLLASVLGLERMRSYPLVARVLVLFCVFHFAFWYGVHLFDNSSIAMAMRRFESWNSINHDIPDRRTEVNKQLARLQGKQLVFVHYSPGHVFQDEWVWNAADIDAAPVVWARDLGPEEDAELIKYYPDRKVWLLDPDKRPVELEPYQ